MGQKRLNIRCLSSRRCVRPRCLSPPPTVGLTVPIDPESGPWELGEEVPASCLQGHLRNGLARHTCQADGTWHLLVEQEVPCIPLLCVVPTSVSASPDLRMRHDWDGEEQLDETILKVSNREL